MADSKLVLHKSLVDISQTIAECIDLLNCQAESKGLQLIYQENPSAPEAIWADPRRLKQVMLNLLTNGIKFTEKGSVSILVTEAEPLENMRKTVAISIVDTGVGIRKEDIPKLFKEFEMLETHRSMNPNGEFSC